ncbi:hypothetical protein SAMN05421877_106235 [Sphingobacterium lactis]|uniref:Uncharacterized protein n=1 Tax=Sphingobacterium lactis TaxID=797291 RepID=A0A1H5Z4B3_9SPHI|nr:hypothetical protein SAMN05421877_106235 [Sphingobacterium lactis]
MGAQSAPIPSQNLSLISSPQRWRKSCAVGLCCGSLVPQNLPPFLIPSHPLAQELCGRPSVVDLLCLKIFPLLIPSYPLAQVFCGWPIKLAQELCGRPHALDLLCPGWNQSPGARVVQMSFADVLCQLFFCAYGMFFGTSPPPRCPHQKTCASVRYDAFRRNFGREWARAHSLPKSLPYFKPTMLAQELCGRASALDLLCPGWNQSPGARVMQLPERWISCASTMRQHPQSQSPCQFIFRNICFIPPELITFTLN